MTLSLDDVRNKRFRMARKSGYEVLEVDEFVDEIEEAFAQIIEENQNLKKQVASLRSSPDGESTVNAESASPAEPAPRPEPEPAPVAQAPLAQPSETVVVTTAREASTAVVRLVQISTEQAERLVAEATAEANRIRQAADSVAQQVGSDARTQAEQLTAEARAQADELQAQTASRSEKLDQEINQRRTEMLGQLSTRRDELSKTVSDLRSFEAAYRANLMEHLRSQIAAIESSSAEPTSVQDPAPSASVATSDESAPAVDGIESSTSKEDDASHSETPRLDALLGDQR